MEGAAQPTSEIKGTGAKSPPAPRWKRFLKGVCFTLVIWLVAALVIEAAARLLLPVPTRAYHSWLGTHTLAGAEYRYQNRGPRREFDQTVRYNRQGFHDVEHAPRKPPGTFRIVVLGDSIVEAREVALEQNLCRMLEGRLTAAGKPQANPNPPAAAVPGEATSPTARAMPPARERRFEVVNLGTSGAGPLLASLLLRHMPTSQDPDLVLMLFFPNDVSDDACFEPLVERDADGLPYRVRTAPGRLPLPASVKHFLRTRSRAWLYLGTQLQLVLDRWKGLPSEGPPDPTHDVLAAVREGTSGLMDAAWERSYQNLCQLEQLARERGARFALVAVPLGHQIQGRQEWEEGRKLHCLERGSGGLVQERLAAFAGQHRIPFLDLRSPFEQVTDPAPLYFPYDGHLTEAGHRAAAKAIAEWLERTRSLPVDSSLERHKR